MLNTILKIFLISGCLLTFHSCQSQDRVTQFTLDGAASIIIKNETSNPVDMVLENWYLLPWESQKIDTTILKNDSVCLQVTSQGNSYFNLKIGQKQLKIFTQPNAQSHLTITEDNGKFQFSGDLKSINEFSANKLGDFNSSDSDWLPRVNFTHGNGSFAELISANDSITLLHRNYLFKHRNELPHWYIQFEDKRLQYLNAYWKLNSLMYRKRMMNKIDIIPDNFLQNTIRSLAINDVSMLGNNRYMNFLSDYLGYQSDPNYQKEMPTSKEQWDSFYEEYILTINDQLVGEVRDVFLAFVFGNILENRKHVFKSHWIDEIQDKDLSNYVHEIINSNPILPKGSITPYFYLQDSSGLIYEPNSFKEKVVLINFWATWCKPCIKEFPFENELIKIFETEPVEIVNICIDSDVVTWKKLIAKYGLKTTNLFAEGSWNNRLQEKFGIQALPHSILIDQRGRVVQNKCPRASENVDNLISQLLKKDH
ncbi:MAG: TlpA disulfide reductase family protein [Cyclobacteriaceae bacterium]